MHRPDERLLKDKLDEISNRVAAVVVHVHNAGENVKSEVCSIKFWLIVIGIVFGWAWLATFGGRIGSYPAVRLANGSLRYLPRTIYKVNPSSQTVVFWKPGVCNTPQRLTDCVVFDRRNWTGHYGIKWVEMQKGKRTYEFEGTNIVPIGSLHWWFLRATGTGFSDPNDHFSSHEPS